jgi:hypothetical protein
MAKAPPTAPFFLSPSAGPVLVDVEKAKQWFEAHWKEPLKCPISGDDKWTVAPHYILLSAGAAPPIYPYVQVTCNGCGYALLFNAVQMGLWPAWKPDA